MTRSRLGFVSPCVQRGKARWQEKKRRSMAVLLSTAMVLAGILLYLWPQMRLVHLGYRQGELQAQRAHALQRQKELLVERATLSRMARIEEIATRRLGLRPPLISQVISVRSGQHTLASRKHQ